MTKDVIFLLHLVKVYTFSNYTVIYLGCVACIMQEYSIDVTWHRTSQKGSTKAVTSLHQFFIFECTIFVYISKTFFVLVHMGVVF